MVHHLAYWFSQYTEEETVDSLLPSADLSHHPLSCALTSIEKIFQGCREEKADCTAGSLRFYHLNSLKETFNSWSFLRAAIKGRGGRKPVAKLGGREGGGRQSCHCFSWDWLCWLHRVRVKQVRYLLFTAPHATFHFITQILLAVRHLWCS